MSLLEEIKFRLFRLFPSINWSSSYSDGECGFSFMMRVKGYRDKFLSIKGAYVIGEDGALQCQYEVDRKIDDLSLEEYAIVITAIRSQIRKLDLERFDSTGHVLTIPTAEEFTALPQFTIKLNK